MKYEVLIVDDSAVMRKKLTAVLSKCDYFEVVGFARNGLDMLEKCKRLNPKVVVMDVEMPILNGIEGMQQLREIMHIPIVIISQNDGHRKNSLSHGADSFFLKEELFDLAQEEAVFDSILTSIRTNQEMYLQEEIVEPELQIEEAMDDAIFDPRLLIIGSSTGGPSALQQIVTDLKVDIEMPIVIVQHIPVGFTKALASRFNAITHLIVKEAEEGEQLVKGTIYIAPAGLNVRINQNHNHYNFSLYEEVEQIHLYKPSIDSLLKSVAPFAKEDLHTFILTGMGNDGLAGCKEVKLHGGKVYAQTEETCVVYGMPKVVTEAQLIEESISLENMAEKMNSLYR